MVYQKYTTRWSFVNRRLFPKGANVDFVGITKSISVLPISRHKNQPGNALGYPDFSTRSCWRCGPFLKSRDNMKVGITSLKQIWYKIGKQCLWRAICKKRADPPWRICVFSACWGSAPNPGEQELFQVTQPSGHRLRNWKLLSLIVSGWMTGEAICPLILLHPLK